MHADRFRYSAANCSIARTLGVVGEKWTLLVLREAFYGVRRFDDFHTALGCARNLLAARLKTLVAHGLLERVGYTDERGRGRHEYKLTDKGRELFPVVVALMQWGDKWTADEAGPAVELFHRDCGEPVAAELTCAAGHAGLGARDAEVRPGPGALEIARIPARIRYVGQVGDTENVPEVEPDYRFTLANERTFLAWQRTALGLLAAAVAVVQLVPELSIAGARHVLGIVLALLAILTSAIGILRWRQADFAMRRGLPLPRHPTPMYLGIGLVVVGLLTVGLVVVKAVAS